MALIKLTAIVDNISGKLNGTVFARNKGGHYMRSKSNPTNPQTTAQAGVRAAFGSVASAWRGLTQQQRESWNAGAENFPYTNRLGDTKTLSGFALHQKLNSNLNAAGSAQELLSVPSPQGVGAVTVGYGDYLLPSPSSLFEVNYDIDGLRTATTVLVYATPGISKGVSNFSNRLRLVTTSTPGVTGETTADITSAYDTRFGTPAAGTKIGVGLRVINNNTGEASPLFTYEADVI